MKGNGAALLVLPAVLLAAGLWKSPGPRPAEPRAPASAEAPVRRGEGRGRAEETGSPAHLQQQAQQEAARKAQESLRAFEASQEEVSGAVEFEISAPEPEASPAGLPGGARELVQSSPRPIGEPGMRLADSEPRRPSVPESVEGKPALGGQAFDPGCQTCRRVPVKALLRVSVLPGLRVAGKPRVARIIVTNTSERMLRDVRLRIEGEARDRVAPLIAPGQRYTMPGSLSLARRAVAQPETFLMRIYEGSSELTRNSQEFKMQCDPPASNLMGSVR